MRHAHPTGLEASRRAQTGMRREVAKLIRSANRKTRRTEELHSGGTNTAPGRTELESGRAVANASPTDALLSGRTFAEPRARSLLPTRACRDASSSECLLADRALTCVVRISRRTDGAREHALTADFVVALRAHASVSGAYVSARAVHGAEARRAAPIAISLTRAARVAFAYSSLRARGLRCEKLAASSTETNVGTEDEGHGGQCPKSSTTNHGRKPSIECAKPKPDPVASRSESDVARATGVERER